MSSDHPGLTVRRVRRGPDVSVLAVSGELSLRSAGPVTGAVASALADVGRVLVDVSGLRLTWPPAVQLFPTVLAAVGGWPGARLVLFDADERLARSLAALRVSRTVPVAPDETTAHRLLEQRPPTVTRHLDLEPARSSPSRARSFARAACDDWQLTEIRDDAVVVVSELVANAVLHAGTPCRLALRCNDRGLTIAVRDRRPDRVPPQPPIDPDPPVDAGPPQRLSGLFIVAALSREWGVLPRTDEKSVWAFLPLGETATYSRTIRRAAHDAVRAVLAHAVNSAQAATEVRHITTRLTELHGATAVRDLTDELALELGEADAAIPPNSDGEQHNRVGTSQRADTRFDDQQRPDLGDPDTP